MKIKVDSIHLPGVRKRVLPQNPDEPVLKSGRGWVTLVDEVGALHWDGMFEAIDYSRRYRRLTIKARPRQVKITAPRGISKTVIRDFVNTRRDWILSQVYAKPVQSIGMHAVAGMTTLEPANWQNRGKIPVDGQMLRLVLGAKQTQIQQDLESGEVVLAVAVPEEASIEVLQNTVVSWLQAHLVERLERILANITWQEKMPEKVLVMRRVSAWADCHRNGHIRVTWPAVAFDDALLQYLLIHELCHLVVFNHSPKFWSLVQQYCADYKTERKRFRQVSIIGLYQCI